MSSLYYRRWTRMYIQPAVKYFKKYDALQPGMQQFMYMLNRQNPVPQNKTYFRKMMVDRDEEINNKLISNLFAKYPDLKYEAVSRQKYHGDNFNSYSYSYAFITEQKKLMKAGYTMKKAFELVQEKFQQKMKRKIDQTLISRGLAIGNRARSLLSIYQQQVQYQSRLKMLRTKRQVIKYQNQLKQIQQAVNRPLGLQTQEKPQSYERIFQKITTQSNQNLNAQTKTQKRHESVARIEGDFQNMFSQFYETAAYKDRLRGLTDDEIKEQIMTSPQKIKRLSRQLINYLKERGGVSIGLSGDLKMGENVNEKLKSFIYSSPSIKIALLNHLIGYQSPQFSIKKRMEAQARNKLASIKTLKIDNLDEQKLANIKQNKLRDLQQVVQKDIPADSRAYKLLQTSQQRMLRLQIKYLTSFIKENEKADDSILNQLKQVIQKFRRLKFRMEKRHKRLAANDLAFPEHYQFGKPIEKIQDVNAEYEELLQYLRKKTEQRRLKAIDIVDDNKINDMMKKVAMDQIPKAEGEEHKHN